MTSQSDEFILKRRLATLEAGGAAAVSVTARFTGNGTSASPLDLAASGVAVGSVGSASQVPVIIFDAYGRATSASTVAVDAIPKTLFDVAGDLVYASAADTPARLAPGSNGQVLTLSGGLPTWAAASGLPSGGVPGQAIVNTGPGTGAWDWFQPNPVFGRRWGYWILAVAGPGTSFKEIGVPGLSVAGTPNTTFQDLGSRGALRDSPSGANIVGVLFTANACTRPGWRPRLRGLFRSPSALTDRRWWFDLFTTAGLNATAPLASGSAASTEAHIGLAYDSAVSANFLLNSGDGATRSGVNTGLAVVASTDYWIDLDWSVAGTLTCRIYVGSPTATPTVTSKTTNLATGTQNMSMAMEDTSLAAGSHDGFDRSLVLLDQN